MITDPYESWLAKQAAKGRKVPDTTAPYYPPKSELERNCTHAGCAFRCEFRNYDATILGDGDNSGDA